MAKYVCSVCGFIYDEAMGIPEQVLLQYNMGGVTRGWVCPLCGAVKSEFEKQDESAASQKKEPDICN